MIQPEWAWVEGSDVLMWHEEQLRRHGGAAGARDWTLPRSALAKPLNLAAYANPDLAELAIASAIGIARNRPFIGGNKRTAFVAAAAAFAILNGKALVTSNAQVVTFMPALAAGEAGEDDAAGWFRARLV